jgi:hypothetical protein
MKIKTNELTGAALDWAVAKCEGIGLGPRGFVVYYHEGEPAMWQPSTDWAQGGPIIEREGIRIVKVAPTVWGAVYSSGDIGREHFASTPLIAAMRCYVASKMGDEVEIPEELT